MKNKENGVRDIVRKNVFTYFNAIFFGLAVLLLIAGSYKSLTFLPVVVANTLIGIFQQIRAKRILDRLTLISQSSYQLSRDGQTLRLPTDELQKGDLLCLAEGQQIPADAEVAEGKLLVNEALLTGESDEIEKLPGAGLLSGSFVVAGSCRARLTRVGAESYASGLTEKAREMKEKPSEMIRDIDLIVKIAGIAILPVGITLLLQGMLANRQSFQAAVVSMVGAVIGMIPEALYLLVTLALALSAARLARNQVLLHDMKSTETLARVDVLCVDKTGTITTGEMRVAEAFVPAGTPEDSLPAARQALAAYLASMTDANATARALRAFCPGGKPMAASSVTPFSSKLKYSELSAPQGVYRLGAPDFVLGQEGLAPFRGQLEARAARGGRVLVFAENRGAGFRPLLFLNLENGLRPNVKETFRYLAEQEVKVLVLSGDDPLTVSAVAQAAEIPGAEHYADASALPTDAALAQALKTCTVFGRVRPEQKKKIVEALKAQGARVAMTGDGVNDAPAIKEADIGVSMGRSGTDISREASSLVLLDDNFATLVAAVEEGRVVYANIRKFMRYLLSCNIGEVFTMFVGMLMGLPVVLTPIQILFVNLVTDGLPAMSLGADPSDGGEMRVPPRGRGESVFSGGLATRIWFRGCMIGLSTLLCFTLLYRGSGGLGAARTGALVTLISAQLLHAFECRSERLGLFEPKARANPALAGSVLLSAALSLALVYLPAARAVFSTVQLSAGQLGLAVGISALAPLGSSLLLALGGAGRGRG